MYTGMLNLLNAICSQDVQKDHKAAKALLLEAIEQEVQAQADIDNSEPMSVTLGFSSGEKLYVRVHARSTVSMLKAAAGLPINSSLTFAGAALADGATMTQVGMVDGAEVDVEESNRPSRQTGAGAMGRTSLDSSVTPGRARSLAVHKSAFSSCCRPNEADMKRETMKGIPHERFSSSLPVPFASAAPHSFPATVCDWMVVNRTPLIHHVSCTTSIFESDQHTCIGITPPTGV